MGMLARSVANGEDFMSHEPPKYEDMSNFQIRQYFPETWINEEITIRLD
jgi:hypothetical protein